MGAADQGSESRRVVAEARGVRKSFRQGSIDVLALRGVDLAVRAGDFVALMGPSGSGKSTLLHLLGGLDRPNEGKVLLEGHELAGLDERELALIRRRRLGFVLQFFSLMPTLTALENVAFPLELDGVDDAEEKAAAMLERVGLGRRAKHLPSELSGGEQQRVAIGRAVIVSPALILADEPTGNLDSRTADTVLELMADIANSGHAIVMATHSDAALRHVTRCVRIADGSCKPIEA